MSDEPLPPPIESPRTVFLQRGAPLIASERGLTPRARLLLESLAGDMALSADDFEQAMAVLQRGEALAAQAVDPQRARFQELLRRQLAELPAKIISARHEQTLLSFAVTQLALPENAARDDIRQVAADLGLRRVTYEEALRYVEESVVQKIGDDTEIDPLAQARLLVIAQTWGLTADDARELIGSHLAENFARRHREKLWSRGVIAGAVGATLLVLAGLLVMAGQRWLARDSTEADVASAPASASAPRRVPHLPDWWDPALTIAITQARSARDDFPPVYDALIAAEPQRRAQGYQLLIERAAAPPFDYRSWKPLEPVILGCYALEPSDEAAAALRHAWLALPEAAIEQVPGSPDGYQAAIRPLAAAVRGMKEQRMPAARAQPLAEEWGALLRTSFEVAAPEPELQRRAMSSLAVVLLERLAKAIEQRPAVLATHYPVLAARAREHVPHEERARLDARVAAAAIEHASDAWPSWEPILNRGVEATDSLALLQLIGAFERCPQREVRKNVAAKLFVRLGISAEGLPHDQYASAMRKALGASLPAVAGDALRWAQLAQRAEIVLQQAASPMSDDVAELRRGVDLAWHANLGLALALERPHPAQFDLWLAAGPPSERAPEEAVADETPRAAPAASEADRLPREAQATFDRYLRDLSGWQRLEEGRRVSYLRGVAQIANEVSDITPAQARQIAGYLLGRKTDEEQGQVMDSVAALRNWKQLRIALADGIDRSPLTSDQVRQLVLAFTGRDVEELEGDRSAARRILLQSVLTELTAAHVPHIDDDPSARLDRQVESLITLYQERAQMLGASPSGVSATAAATLRQSLDRLAPRGSHDGSERLAQLADIVGHSDAQRTVIVQRALVERVLADLTARRPGAKAQAHSLVRAYHAQNAAARNVLAQVSAGEATLLRLCLLYQEP
jgi:hypothetical protein